MIPKKSVKPVLSFAPMTSRQALRTKKQWIYKKQLEFAKQPNKVSIKKYSKSFIRGRMRHYSDQLQVTPQKIVFKKLRGRWGSTTKDNTINLSVDLLKAPKSVIDMLCCMNYAISE